MDAQATSGLSSVLLYTSGVAALTQGYQPSRDWSINLRGFNATSYGLFHNGLFWDTYAQTDSFELEQVDVAVGKQWPNYEAKQPEHYGASYLFGPDPACKFFELWLEREKPCGHEGAGNRGEQMSGANQYSKHKSDNQSD